MGEWRPGPVHVPLTTPPLELSTDSLLGGDFQFQQPRRGYRVNVDSVLLAAFAASGPRGRCVVDLGAGVGVVGLLFGHFAPAEEVVLVERDGEVAAIAEENLRRAGVRGRVLVADLENPESLAELERSADVVVSNPPFFRSGEHRTPREPERRSARMGELAPFLAAAARALSGNRARAVFAYPAPGLGELLAEARQERLVPKRLRFVHAFADSPARLALIELRQARPAGLVVEPPLVEWLEQGVPSPELAALNAARAGDRR